MLIKLILIRYVTVDDGNHNNTVRKMLFIVIFNLSGGSSTVVMIWFAHKILTYHCIVCKAKIHVGKLYFSLRVGVIRNCQLFVSMIFLAAGRREINVRNA